MKKNVWIPGLIACEPAIVRVTLIHRDAAESVPEDLMTLNRAHAGFQDSAGMTSSEIRCWLPRNGYAHDIGHAASDMVV